MNALQTYAIAAAAETGVGMFIAIESIDAITLGINGMDVTTQEGAGGNISAGTGKCEQCGSTCAA